jgi:hypothetical protein
MLLSGWISVATKRPLWVADPLPFMKVRLQYLPAVPRKIVNGKVGCAPLFPVEDIQVILGCAPQEIVQRIGMSFEYAEGGWGILRAMHNGVITG